MGLFGYQTARTKKSFGVGVTKKNDWGPFSGLEVAIDKNIDIDIAIDKNLVDFRHQAGGGGHQETDNEEKRTEKPKSASRKAAGFFFQCKSKNKDKHKHNGTCRHNESHHKLNLNTSSSKDLSVYTSSASCSWNASATAKDGPCPTKPKSRKATAEASGGGSGPHPSSEGFVTLDHVSDLILDLDTAVVVGAKRPIRTLKMLLALSSSGSKPSPSQSISQSISISPSPSGIVSLPSPASHKSIRDTRIEMVRAENGTLVPVLLSFLNRCMVQSKEHTLALLVLGNLSIPQENKKTIALDCKGAAILARLLCEDPSSHLVALVLVNLTYDSSLESNTTAIEVTVARTNSNININNKIDVIHRDRDGRENGGSDRASLRKELLATNGTTALVESLAFALRVSSLTQDEYEQRRDTIEDCNYSEDYLSPATRLSILMAKDQQLRQRSSEMEHQRQRVLPATVGADQILRQLRSNETELHQWGSIDGAIVGGSQKVAKEQHSLDIRTQLNRSRSMRPPPMLEKSNQLYPETAKWCLSALRNLTKPCNCDATAAHVLIKSGIFSLIVQYITTLGGSIGSGSIIDSYNTSHTASSAFARNRYVAQHQRQQLDNNFLSASYGKLLSTRNVVGSPQSNTGDAVNGDGDGGKTNSESERGLPLLILTLLPTSNSPYSWQSNSMQDAALSIVLNLSASCKSREYMNEPQTVKVLSMIAEYPRLVGRRTRSAGTTIASEERQTMNFQALKARMALSYLIGSQGHFGQSKLRSSASTVQANRANSPLVMSDSDVQLFVELLANAMNHRGKDGSGGGNYLSGTFDLKCVVFSLRCLLTHTSNQERLATQLGLELNSLLINALARHALEPSTSPMDSESAGQVVFSLYLLSNHGFEELPFLPEMYRPQHRHHHEHRHNHNSRPSMTSLIDDDDHGLAANILVSYLCLSNTPPEGCHAAKQLLLRLKYLNFENHSGAATRTTHRRTMQNIIRSADLKINYILLAKIKRVKIPNRKHGAKPDPAIFHRPVLRCQKPCSWDENCRLLSLGGNKKQEQKKIEWSSHSTVSTFVNALVAVQQLSYGSIKVRHSSGSIDDIAIANTISRCCASNETSFGCYNFLWAWEDGKRMKDCGDCIPRSLSPQMEGRHPPRRYCPRSNDDEKSLNPCGSSSVTSSDSSASSAAGSTSKYEKFSFLRLCGSTESTDSAISEI